MQVVPLLLGVPSLSLQHLVITPKLITISAAGNTATSACPACGKASARVHSHYTRTLGDLPCHGIPVRLQLRVRRFFCDNPDCPRCIFAECLAELTRTCSRKTTRLTQSLGRIGLALGGAAGSRLAAGLGMSCSASTMLRLIRGVSGQAAITPRVLGIDDWAFRRGHHYGTILCDLERHRPVDLLPDRTSETLAEWLRKHPGVEIISRDRAGTYAQGARTGAPQALQVADRFHLVHNLQDALKRLLERQWRCIGDVAKLTPKGASPERFAPAQESTVAHEVAADAGTLAAGTVDTSTAGQQRSRDARDRRLQKYQQVMELHGQGLPIREIARRLGIHRETVDRFTRAGAFLERVPRRYASGSDQIADAIRRRWQEGCHNARQIARELAAQGFKGSYYMVRRRVHKMRLRGEIAVDDVTETAAAAAEPLSPTRLSWILLREENELDEQARSVVEAVCRQCAEVQSARNLAHDFRRLVGQRHGDRLDAWVTRATAETAPREISSFAACLKQDYDAVKTGLTLEWSNGQVEGQVNRLKLLKRQMYGRAGFDLLRARVLRAG